jgi:hypothetical protein
LQQRKLQLINLGLVSLRRLALRLSRLAVCEPLLLKVSFGLGEPLGIVLVLTS